MAQQRAFQTNAYANQLEAEEAAASEAIAAQQQAQEEAQQAQAAAQQAQEEAAARQNPQRKEYWAGQWRSYGQQLDEANRTAPRHRPCTRCRNSATWPTRTTCAFPGRKPWREASSRPGRKNLPSRRRPRPSSRRPRPGRAAAK